MAKTVWRVNDLEYLEAPGLSAFVRHCGTLLARYFKP